MELTTDNSTLAAFNYKSTLESMPDISATDFEQLPTDQQDNVGKLKADQTFLATPQLADPTLNT